MGQGEWCKQTRRILNFSGTWRTHFRSRLPRVRSVGSKEGRGPCHMGCPEAFGEVKWRSLKVMLVGGLRLIAHKSVMEQSKARCCTGMHVAPERERNEEQG
jgi:hypothetical protein